MRQVIAVTLVAMVVLIGCKKEPPPPPTPTAPPPPTAAQIYSELKRAVQPLWIPLDGQTAVLPGVLEKLPDDLAPLKMQHSSTENGRDALGRLQKDLENMILRAKELGNYRLLKALCRSYKVLQPNSDRYAKDLRYANLILQRPMVEYTGFFEVDGEPYIFLKVTNLQTKRVTSYKVREGDKFHRVLRLVRIIGNRSAFELEYLPVNQLYNIPGTSSDLSPGLASGLSDN